MVKAGLWHLATAAPVRGFYDAGLGRFLLSPGFAGLAALLGGALAYVAARRQSADARTKAADEREALRQQRWWEALTWIYDRATAEREDARLSGRLALDLLERLLDEAQTPLETQAVVGLLGLFEDATGEGEAM